MKKSSPNSVRQQVAELLNVTESLDLEGFSQVATIDAEEVMVSYDACESESAELNEDETLGLAKFGSVELRILNALKD